MKDIICQTLGENIKKYRKLRGLTQEKLAETLEMEIKSLSLIETGNCFVSSKTLEKLTKILNVSPADLLTNINLNETETIYKDILKSLELIKNNPAKLRILNSLLTGLL